MDVAYICGPGMANEQLRHSLRSLSNLPHDRVWIAGYRPQWVTGVEHIPVRQTPMKHENTWAALRALAERGPDRFYLFNDDFFVMRPVASVPVYYREPLDAAIDRYQRRGGMKPWLRRALFTQEILARMGRDPDTLLSYELHVPLPLNRADLARSIEALDSTRTRPIVGFSKRTFVCNYLEMGGQQADDCKVSRSRDTDRPEPLMSTSDVAWRGMAGRWIRNVFNRTCRYESRARRGRGQPIEEVPDDSLDGGDLPAPDQRLHQPGHHTLRGPHHGDGPEPLGDPGPGGHRAVAVPDADENAVHGRVGQGRGVQRHRLRHGGARRVSRAHRSSETQAGPAIPDRRPVRLRP